MIDLKWLTIGIISGLLIASVLKPPKRMVPSVPDPKDSSKVYHTATGCVRVSATEVPCTAEPESFNLLASLRK